MHFGHDDEDTLVIRRRSLDFKTTLNPKIVAKAFRNDPEAAAAEWDAEFRAEIASFFDSAVIEDEIDYERPLELPPRGLAFILCVCRSDGRRGPFLHMG